MSTAHQLVSLETATAGMTLSDDILDQQGKVLLSQGTVLTASTIAALGRHDIALLPIIISGGPAAVIDEAAVTARLDYLFRGSDAATANPILHDHIAAFRLERGVAP